MNVSKRSSRWANTISRWPQIGKYKVEVAKFNTEYVVEVSLLLKEVPNFAKFMREYCLRLKPKVKKKEEYVNTYYCTINDLKTLLK